ncbi:MAG: hypothetical protein LBN39_09460 [Planctomycetaceae bacterium]|nr:hypothetical protein [Planctomycetaceae bacterium]
MTSVLSTAALLGAEPVPVNVLRDGQQPDVLVVERHSVPPPTANPLPREITANPATAQLPNIFAVQKTAAPIPVIVNSPPQSSPSRTPYSEVQLLPPPGTSPEIQETFTMSNVPMQQLEQTLRSVLQHHLVHVSPGHYRVSVERKLPNGVPPQILHCTLELDYPNKRVVLSGEQQICGQMIRLVHSMDQLMPTGSERQILSTRNINPVSLTRILETNRVPTGKARYLQPPDTPRNNVSEIQPVPQLEFRPETTAPKRVIPPEPAKVLFPVPADLPPLSYRTYGPPAASQVIQQVAYQAELPADAGGAAFSPDAAGAGKDAMEVVTDFRYQILPDLDVLIIDATGAEVARFKDMIDQIAELSKNARPDIEIYPLKYVNCISLNYVITQLYVDVFKTRQGTVRFLPMVNPNAILLVGWGDSMIAAKDLIKSLDQPVADEHSLLKVIKLKHASAQYLVTTLRGAFPPLAAGSSANAFAPRLQLFADTRTNSLIVQAGQNDMRDIEKLIAEIDVAETQAKLQIRQFKAKHTLASDLANKLTQSISAGVSGIQGKTASLELLIETEKGKKIVDSGLLTDVKITAHDPTNTVIVTGPERCMNLIEELLKVIDSPSATAVVKVFPILYGDAKSMIMTLRELLPTQLAGETGPKLPGAKDEEALVPVRFAVDSRTNCILAVGAEGDLKIIEAMLYSLDREDQQTRKNYVYMLKSMQAEAVATAINEYIRSKRIIQQNAPGVISPYQQIESEIIVIPEMVSNSLIVSATSRYYDEVLELIKEIDQPPPQVVIQVLIGEVTLGNSKEFGAEFGIQDSLLFDRSTFSNIAQGTRTITQTLADGTKTVVEEPVITNGSVSPGWMFNENPKTSLSTGYNTNSSATAGNVGSQLLTNFGTGRVGAETGFGGMVFSANSDAVSVMIRALQENNRLEILSRPQIMAMNNQESMIHVGQKVPRIGGVSLTNYGSQSNVEEEKVGLMLTVKPSISPDGNIVMMVVAEKSSVGTEAEGVVVANTNEGVIRSPKINTINALTMISAADNETVVLGGLIQTTNQDLTRKVPLLGDIPVVGRLFRYDYKRCARSELLIILTPRIVRDKSDMEAIKQIEAARMNWCLAGVSKLYGDIGTYTVIDKEPYTGDAPVIHPEAVKEGDLKPLKDVPVPKLPPKQQQQQPLKLAPMQPPVPPKN